MYVAFSRCAPDRSKALRCRCSHSTASLSNAVREPARNGLSLDNNKLWTSGMRRHRVAALANGMTIARTLRLVPAHA